MFATKLLPPTEENIEYCAELIKRGEVVGMPTETVYGLAADAFNDEAVRKIFRAKGRPCDNPLIVHISRIDMLSKLAHDIPDTAFKIAERFWCGPLTMILPKSDKIPTVTSGGLKTVGIRMPENKIARALIDKSGVPLAAPSANLSGKPSPTTALHVLNDLSGVIPAILDGGECKIGVESTVISFDPDGAVRILRPGAVTREQLLTVTDKVLIDEGILNEVSPDAVVSSPGMKYKHYSPKAEVYLVDGGLDGFLNYVKDRCSEDTYLMCFDGDVIPDRYNVVYYGKNHDEQAKRLFAVLRELDDRGAKTVYARMPSADGVGLAVLNRILRAAAFKLVKVGD